MVNINILCYNEAVLLPHTIRHYNTLLPSGNITIYDNESTDGSVTLAKDLGCEVVSWSSENRIDDYKYQHMKNTCWEDITSGWVIMCDMDEWLCVTEGDLVNEQEKGCTVLSVSGYDMIGCSQQLNLADIDLHNIDTGTRPISGWQDHDKNLCFLRPGIHRMNYSLGSHQCSPQGNVIYSDQVYINKHMSYPGLPFVLDRHMVRKDRSEYQRSKERLGWQYRLSCTEKSQEYNRKLDHSETIPGLEAYNKLLTAPD